MSEQIRRDDQHTPPEHMGELVALARQRSGNLIPQATEQVAYAKVVLGNALLQPEGAQARDDLFVEARDALAEVCTAMGAVDKGEARNAWSLVVDAYVTLADTHILTGKIIGAANSPHLSNIDLANHCYGVADEAAKTGGGIARMQVHQRAALAMASARKHGKASGTAEGAWRRVLPWTAMFDREHLGETRKIYADLQTTTGFSPEYARAKLEAIYTAPLLDPSKTQ